ncbi:MAG: hypothetical protein DCC55_08775 [Chloroflexi bacterium]|nr:MAG: hypothetical protein DCC55_08775 [Chloroflexota bacterium]
MATTQPGEKTNASEEERKRESGMPGGGQGRVEDVRGSGVYPASGPRPAGGDAPFRGMASWGQGERGAAGYENHGESELRLGPDSLGKPPQQARDIMTKDPTCCLPGDTVDQVAQLMKSEDIGPVPVVENHETKKLVGIVTDRDLAIKVVAEGRDPKQTRVEEVMTRELVTCRPEDDLQQVFQAMADHQVRRIPVVTTDGRIVGIIAQADIATRVDQPEPTAEVVEEISRPSG